MIAAETGAEWCGSEQATNDEWQRWRLRCQKTLSGGMQGGTGFVGVGPYGDNVVASVVMSW